jgi:hypothetical protein
MNSTLTDPERTAIAENIAEKLADIRVFQNLLIANEQQLIGECNDSEICEGFQKMLAADRKNLEVVETVITAYGIQANPKETVQEMVRQSQNMMKDSELTLYEKVGSHELLKHVQVMSGLIVHKAFQVAGSDISQAITPLNTVNVKNRAHQEQLQGMLIVLGTRELTGQDADRGVGSRVEDTMATVSGMVSSVVTKSSDQSDLKIQDGLQIDYQKANGLLLEIERNNDLQKIEWSMLRNFTKT